MSLAPVILFAYNRPQFTRQTLEALAANHLANESTLYIFADGPKANAPDSIKIRIGEVRKLLRERKWCKEVIIKESNTNKGLAQSVIDGVTEIMNKHGKVIAIEDDVVTSPWFLQFMNDALVKYEHEERVLSIGSWNYYYNTGRDSNFFTHLPDTIAWASWQRAWKLLETDSRKLYNELRSKDLLHLFNVNDRFPYTDMLQQQIDGKVDSWAIRWTGTAVLHNTLTLYPPVSLSKHIGFGTDSTHVKSADYNKDLQLAMARVPVDDVPVSENMNALVAWIDFEKNIRPLKTSLKKKAKHYLKKTIKGAVPGFVKKFYLHNKYSRKYGWHGNYASWSDARKECTGYDAAHILEKVKNATLKVKRGEAMYERDSMVFDYIEYSWQLLDNLLSIASKKDGRLSVIDFGGSLGTTYFQNRYYLNRLKDVSWSVVEQHEFVTIGKEEIADDRLKFFYTIDEAIAQRGMADVLIISSVLPYFEHPYDLIKDVTGKNIPYIIIDTTYFNPGQGDRLTVQHVPPVFYDASYPAWLLDYNKVIAAFKHKYELIEEYKNNEIMYFYGELVQYRGFVLKLKSI